MNKYIVNCCYLNDNIKDEIIMEVLYNGRIYRGTLSEVVK